MLTFDTVNWGAVAVSVVAAMVIGAIWYSPILFGTIWQREAKLSDETIRGGNMAMMYGGTIVLAAVAATLFAAVVKTYMGADPELGDVLVFGLIVGAGWIATSFATGYIFERRSMTLWLINAAYNVVLFLAFALIIGLWT